MTSDTQTRFEIFKRFVEETNTPDRKRKDQCVRLVKEYSDRCLELIRQAPETPEAFSTLGCLSAGGIRLFISSVTSAKMLKDAVASRGIANLLDGILGAPTTKAEPIAR